ncbi:MAG: hypothetical protein O7D91_12675 [Planctomycetota bacterium]|nr:hypothetical protein [Planctomycetota bacterium]
MSADSPIVEEVRERRRQISELFGNDLDKYCEHLRQLQKQYHDRLVDQCAVVRSMPKREK